MDSLIKQPEQAQKSGLAITSLVCGIASICCLGLLAGIPAVICGHIAQSKINTSPTLFKGGGMALTGLIMGYVSIALSLVVLPILAAIAIPAVVNAKEHAIAIQQVLNAQQICHAIAQSSERADSESAGKSGFPADMGAQSANQVAAMLVEGGFLSAGDLKRLHFDQFLIGNVSKKDPADTILLRSKPAKPYSMVAIVLRDGSGQAVKSNRPVGNVPPRDPQFLP